MGLYWRDLSRAVKPLFNFSKDTHHENSLSSTSWRWANKMHQLRLQLEQAKQTQGGEVGELDSQAFNYDLGLLTVLTKRHKHSGLKLSLSPL